MITSADNPKAKQARALLSRRVRAEAGQCLAEGVRLIEDALRAGIKPALVLFVASAADAPRAKQLLDRLRDAGTPHAEVSPTVFGAISDTVSSQGIIAVLPATSGPPPHQPSFLLLLDQLRDPGNLGAVLRSAEAAGVELALLTVGCADPWSPKALRAGMGAQFRLPLATSVTSEEIASRLDQCPLWLADTSAPLEYDLVDWVKPCTIGIGGETTGFSPSTAALARGSVRVPMRGATDSLNASMAATVLMFEVARQRRRNRDTS